MTQDRYERINQKLLSVTKDDPEAKECKKILDMLEIPVFGFLVKLRINLTHA